MKYLALFFLVPQINALEFNRGENGAVTMTTASCSVARTYIQEIVTWSQTLNSDIDSSKCEVQELPEGCIADMTNCLPERVAEVHGVHPTGKGPNCWNLVLWLNSMIPSLRWSSADEMSFFMSSDLCRPLRPNEQRMPGDIIAIKSNARDKDTGEITSQEYHGMIYISEDLVFSKDSLSHYDEYSITLADEVYNKYYVTPECRGNNNNLECYESADFFRCTLDSNSLTNQITPNTSEELQLATTHLDSFESCVQANKFNENFSSEASFALLGQVIDAVSAYGQQNVGQQRSLEDQSAINTLQLRVAALRNNFNSLHDSDTEAKLEYLELALQ